MCCILIHLITDNLKKHITFVRIKCYFLVKWSYINYAAAWIILVMFRYVNLIQLINNHTHK
jgi:hypothetical protein